MSISKLLLTCTVAILFCSDLSRPVVLAQEKALEKERAALQGTWVALRYEERGKLIVDGARRTFIIKDDNVTFQHDGKTIHKGTLVLDPTKNPKHLDIRYSSGQTDLTIYVRAGDYIIHCGNRDGKTRPVEFLSGAEKGGAYLTVWKIER